MPLTSHQIATVFQQMIQQSLSPAGVKRHQLDACTFQEGAWVVEDAAGYSWTAFEEQGTMVRFSPMDGDPVADSAALDALEAKKRRAPAWPHDPETGLCVRCDQARMNCGCEPLDLQEAFDAMSLKDQLESTIEELDQTVSTREELEHFVRAVRAAFGWLPDDKQKALIEELRAESKK